MQHALNEKQRAVIPVAAFTANGDMVRLGMAANASTVLHAVIVQTHNGTSC